MFNNILLAFIPIFVAVDVIGVLPIFIAFSYDLSREKKLQIVRQSVVTALILAFSFIVLGKLVFRLLTITIGDFMIAGGAVLFCIALNDILTTEKKRRIPSQDLGAVPLGTPLIVGPAVLTTSLIIVDHYGVMATLIAILGNVLLAGFILSRADTWIRVIGKSGARALSKIMALFLAAIAVMMVRKGIMEVLAGISM